MNSKTDYGYPISSIFFQICGMILLILFLMLSIFSLTYIATGILIAVLFVYWYVFIYSFKERFSRLRNKILTEMNQHLTMKGDEYILDLGTGAGYIAINLSKKLSGGRVVGVDKYDQKTSILGENFFEELKINFFKNKLNQAKQNAFIEKQQDKITLIKSDLKNHFPFNDNSFDVVFSSQFLYCIPQKEINRVLEEINRVLKPSGQLIFFESEKFLNWDITHIQTFFQKKGYHTTQYPLKNMTNKTIFTAMKPAKNNTTKPF